MSRAKLLGSREGSQPRKKTKAPLRATSKPRKISTTCCRTARGKSCGCIAPESTRTWPMRRRSSGSRSEPRICCNRDRSTSPMRQATSPSRSPGLLELAQATLPWISATVRSNPSLRASRTPSRSPLWRKLSRSAGGKTDRSPARTASDEASARASASRPADRSCSATSRSGDTSSRAYVAPP